MSARIPTATYRLQFNAGFMLAEGADLVDYLDELGISDCYSSPLAMARPGSMHGYDVTDPSTINPELGGEEQLRRLGERLREHQMGLVLDIVPNHMCIAHPSNRWWWDVLENGPASQYARFFDVDWSPPKVDLHNKVLLPVLGDQYGRVLENQQITISYDGSSFHTRYYEIDLPVAPRSWVEILEPTLAALRRIMDDSQPAVMELASIITAIHHLPPQTETEEERIRERQREKEIIKGRLASLVEKSPEVRRALDSSLANLNGVKGDPRSFDRLEQLLDQQAYRLSFWHVATDEINYRRFFDVNDLAAIRVEEPAVFEAVHELVFKLVRERIVTGLRIDHADGLLDPGLYLRMLQERCAAEAAAGSPSEAPAGDGARPFYVVAEKILTGSERLHAQWPIYGTTGYEFLNLLNGILVERDNRWRFDELYSRFVGQRQDFADVVYECKKLVLRALMSGEQNVLARRLDRISEQHRWSRDFTLNNLGRVLAETIACFPVYRSYVTSQGNLSDEDRRYINIALETAKRRNAALSESTFDFLGSVLLLEHPESLGLEDAAERLRFTLHFQQVTSPVMAKGFEDTALYRYYPLASLNEVGGNPLAFGAPVEEFHRQNAARLSDWPHALSATATHDTKRGEDARARLSVLSETPDIWERAIWRWHHLTESARVEHDGGQVPDPNEEYLFYQTLIGTWPWNDLSAAEHEHYVERLVNYMDKAAKEAKLKTSWIHRDEEHDRYLAQFVRTVMRPGVENSFVADVGAFAARTMKAGMLNSLSQLLLKLTAPGVPDIYQGTELWDLTLVDPDNRQPVDFAMRRRLLAEIRQAAAGDRPALISSLLRHPADGRLKLFVLGEALSLRRRHVALFSEGAYTPLETAGSRRRHALAFARGSAEDHVIVVAGRLFTAFPELPAGAIGEGAWGSTYLSAPDGFLRDRYTELFTGRVIEPDQERDAQQLCISDIFAAMPIAMLVAGE